MKRIICLFIAGVVGLAIIGCDKETDPQAKVDAPGYYNGPMKPRGGSGADTAGTAGAATAGAPPATTGQ